MFWAFLSVAISACKDDSLVRYDYQITFNSPSSADKIMGDSLTLNINFKSLTGEPIHHINVQILNTADQAELYNAPTEARINDQNADYTFTKTFALVPINGFNAGSTYQLKAKVWGDEGYQGQIEKSVLFKVR